MAEAGVDISKHKSKHVDELKGIKFDYVITLCGHASENCPIFPGKTKVIHVGFDDPPSLAKFAKTEKKALECYRRVRDEIRDFVAKIPDNLRHTTEGELSCVPCRSFQAKAGPPINKTRGLACPSRRSESARENPRSVRENRVFESTSSVKFYNPYEPVERSEHHLPHRQQGQIFYFVSWRMSDSLPKEKIAQWKKERETWLESHPKPWDEITEDEFYDRFSGVIEEWLDSGEGSCILRNPQISKIIADAFLHFNGERYALESFVIMPNHVHVLFASIGSHKLEKIVKSWKGFTAYKINELLNKAGEFWQEDYWDRMIRSEKHLRKCHEYIIQNPIRAHLCDGEYLLYTKERGFSNPRVEGKSRVGKPALR